MKKSLLSILVLFSLVATTIGCNSNVEPINDNQQTYTSAVDIEDPTPTLELEREYIIIRGVEYSTSLTDLSLFNMGLVDEDIEHLRYMVNLRVLNLSYDIEGHGLNPDFNPDYADYEINPNQITDLSPLLYLTSLEVLWLCGNNISDISPLSNLADLQELSLFRNSVSDLTALRELTNLVNLDLGENKISDITPLSGLPNLHRLQVHSNQIQSVSELIELPNLHRLQLENNQITDLTNLQGLESIEILFLNDNQISDISALSNLKNLQELFLEGNRISDLSAVDHVAFVDIRP